MRRKHFDIQPILGLFGIILTFAFIVGCFYAVINNELNRITEGTIIDKQIYTEYTEANVSNGSGSYSHRPTRYSFLLEGEKNGKAVKYWTEVSADEYARFRVGEYYRK